MFSKKSEVIHIHIDNSDIVKLVPLIKPSVCRIWQNKLNKAYFSLHTVFSLLIYWAVCSVF